MKDKDTTDASNIDAVPDFVVQKSVKVSSSTPESSIEYAMGLWDFL